MRPTKIVVSSATCGAFGTGQCWSAASPYWDGHYPTKAAALTAARKTKKERDARWREAQKRKG